MGNDFFLVIGTYRAGTTWLQKVFEQHPEIYVPEQKELFYFSRFYDRGHDWYESFFKRKDEKLIGEICPSYLKLSDVTASRIHNYNSNTKIIAILRNPYEQVESMLRLHSTRVGIEAVQKMAFDEIKRKFVRHVMYYSKLEPFYKEFDEKNILLMEYDMLKESKEIFLNRIYEFLQIEPFYPVNDKKVNMALQPKLPFLAKFISKTGVFLRDSNMYWLSNILKKMKIVSFLKKANSTTENNYLKLPDEFRSKMKSLLIEDYRKLDDFANMNISRWLN